LSTDDLQQTSDAFKRCISVADFESVSNLADSTSEWCSNNRRLSKSCCKLVHDDIGRNVCLSSTDYGGIDSRPDNTGALLTHQKTLYNAKQVRNNQAVYSTSKLQQHLHLSRSCCHLVNDKVSNRFSSCDNGSEFVERHPAGDCCFTQQLSGLRHQGDFSLFQDNLTYGIQRSAHQPHGCQKHFLEYKRCLSNSCSQFVSSEQSGQLQIK